MKIFIRLLIWKSAIFLLLFQASAQSSVDTLKVLFLGNSYTYFWNMPQTVQAMAIAEGYSLQAKQSTAGGTTWKQHWEGDKGLKSIDLINSGDWDVVVLQNHSMSVLNNIEQFMEYGSRLIDLVRKNGAEPVLYETWARAFNPLMLEKVSGGYMALAEKKDVQLVPVGQVWERARMLRPNINLYDPDQSHPSTVGSYLNALIFYTFLTGKPIDGISKRITDVDKDGQKLYLSIVSEEDSDFLKGVVKNYLTSKLEMDGTK